MKKQRYAVGVAVLLAALLAFAGVARSAMWAGVELGSNWANGTVDIGPVSGNANFNNPRVFGGATIGYDFVNSGFGAYNWPEWMKYFSFATDLTYNRLSLRRIRFTRQVATTTNEDEEPVTTFSNVPGQTDKDGYCVAWTFLFMAHYGFFPDSIIPTGRVNPYIGVGPAIVWSGFDLGGFGGKVTSTNIALVVEPGIRWVAFPNVSIDTAFRFRYCAPSYEVADNVNIKVNPLNQFTLLVRANYHF